MRRRLAAVLVVLGIVLAVLGARWRRVHSVAPAAQQGPGEGLDFALSPFAAGFDAPAGATPCETAYNALHAIDDKARSMGKTTPWSTLPDRESLLARCNALPPQEQQCYQPRYAAQNHPVCDPIFRKYKKNNPLWGPAWSAPGGDE